MIFRIILGIIMVTYCQNLTAQHPKVDNIKLSAQKIEDIVKSEKARLDSTINAINLQLEKGEITTAEANEETREIAEDVSNNIVDMVNEIQDEIVEDIQALVDEILETTNSLQENANMDEDYNDGDDNGDDGDDNGDDDDDDDDDDDFEYKGDFDFKESFKNGFKKKNKSEKRITDQTVFSFGFSSFLNENDFSTIEESPLNLYKSRYWEIGYTQKARLSANSSAVSLKYGLSLMIHNMKLDENQIFVKNGNVTNFVDFDFELEKSKLRTTYLAVPVHLEFDFSKSRRTDEGQAIVRSQRSVRLGIGGFVGLPIRTKQVLEYKANGHNVEESQKGNFNVNQFAYGLSAYLGYKDFSFYSKLDLNSMFKNNTPEQNLVTFGVRWDWN